AYRTAMGSVVAIGDPVCAVDEAVTLARAFTAAARRKGLASVFAATTERFAMRMAEHGAAAIEFGRELIFDPRRDSSAGSKGRELRKKLTHARRSGLHAGEYDRMHFRSPMIEE